jgi:hypothetical protein
VLDWCFVAKGRHLFSLRSACRSGPTRSLRIANLLPPKAQRHTSLDGSMPSLWMCATCESASVAEPMWTE